MEYEQHIVESGQVLRTHVRGNCIGEWCPIHSQMPGPWSSWPRQWREDREMMERVCPHGVGHPAAETYANRAAHTLGLLVHGCDGCPCSPRRWDMDTREPGMPETGDWYLLPKDQGASIERAAEDLLIEVGRFFNQPDDPPLGKDLIKFLGMLRTFTNDLRTATKEKR